MLSHLFMISSFSFLHFSDNMEIVLKPVVPAVHNFPETLSSFAGGLGLCCRWFVDLEGVAATLSYYLEAIDERKG